MTSTAWLQQMREICAKSDWQALAELRHKTNQAFADSCDFSGLRAFYCSVIEDGLDAAKADVARIDDISGFQTDVARCLAIAKESIQVLDGIKGLYFEYFYDGGDSCAGNLFLCTEYTEDDDSWGAEFEEDGFIEGPGVSEYLNFDPELEWDDFSSHVALEYVNGILMAAALEAWHGCGIHGIPFGFANHDHEMIRVC